MKSGETRALCVCLFTGGVCGLVSADEPLVTLEASHGRVVEVAHIYFNIASGERVVTLLGDQGGDGQTSGPEAEGSSLIWSSEVNNPCADAGFTTQYYYVLDSICSGTSCQGWTLSDFGDIAHDQVVDCVRVDWITNYEDVDNDSDGVGDGIVGFGAKWSYWEADNGRVEDQPSRARALGLVISSLPGRLDSSDPGAAAKYTMDVDLVSGAGVGDVSFELGDTDGDLGGAATHRAFYGQDHPDLDGDSLFDWGWSVRFYQPGLDDIDGDGVVDGETQQVGVLNAVSFGAPQGVAINNGDGTWTWEIDTGVEGAGTGQEDLFAIYDGLEAFQGSYWSGGFSCDEQFGQYTPPAMFQHALFGPNSEGDCIADLTGDGVLNFFDISQFLILFIAQDPEVDFTGDGDFNFFDVSLFLSDFSAGCP